MRLLCLIACASLACSASRSDETQAQAPATGGEATGDGAGPSPSNKKKAPMPTLPANPIPVDWKLTNEGDVLRVHYTVENTSDQRYYVCDKLIRGAGQKTYETLERLSVLNTKLGPDAIAFMLGSPQPSTPAAWHIPVTYVAVEPGAKLESHRDVPLPLAPFDVHGTNKPLAKSADKAYLMISAFAGEPPRWKELAGKDGKPIRYPDEATLQILFAGPLPLPVPVN